MQSTPGRIYDLKLQGQSEKQKRKKIGEKPVVGGRQARDDFIQNFSAKKRHLKFCHLFIIAVVAVVDNVIS